MRACPPSAVSAPSRRRQRTLPPGSAASQPPREARRALGAGAAGLEAGERAPRRYAPERARGHADGDALSTQLDHGHRRQRAILRKVGPQQGCDRPLDGARQRRLPEGRGKVRHANSTLRQRGSRPVELAQRVLTGPETQPAHAPARRNPLEPLGPQRFLELSGGAGCEHGRPAAARRAELRNEHTRALVAQRDADGRRHGNAALRLAKARGEHEVRARHPAGLRTQADEVTSSPRAMAAIGEGGSRRTVRRPPSTSTRLRPRAHPGRASRTAGPSRLARGQRHRAGLGRAVGERQRVPGGEQLKRHEAREEKRWDPGQELQARLAFLTPKPSPASNPARAVTGTDGIPGHQRRCAHAHLLHPIGVLDVGADGEARPEASAAPRPPRRGPRTPPVLQRGPPPRHSRARSPQSPAAPRPA